MIRPAPRHPAGGGLVGTWHGVGSTIGRIDLAADGTYSSPNGGKGTWRATPEGAVFTGPLEFQWMGKNGKQYFAFGKF